MLPTDIDAGIAHLLGVMADPTRTRIVDVLGHVEELCVTDLALALGSSESAVSYALRVLRMNDVVQRLRRGRHGYYRLRDRMAHQVVEAARQRQLSSAQRG